VAEQASMNPVECITRLVISLRRSDGQTLMEYGVLIAMIALVVVAAAVLFGGSVASLTASNAAGV
jgi:Flp pilus assembly pilin Flp